MSNSVAEAYLLIFRSSMVPVIGEAVPFPFDEQIELDSWQWELKYDEKASDSKGRTAAAAAAAAADKSDKPAFKNDELIRQVLRLQTSSALKQEERDKKVRELIKKATDPLAKSSDSASAAPGDDDGDNKLTFTFKKTVDLATTQLLNSMKAGEKMPRAVITLFHRSNNAPVTLVVTFGNVVLTKYSLESDVDEKMTDMTESWTATYETVDYAYQNRPAASGPNGVTKGTARVFKMKLKNLF